MLTLNQIKNQLSNIAVAHSNINHFHFGELYDFASSGVVDYPAMAVERNPIPYTNNTLKYSFNVYVMDLVHKDASNRDEVLSDTLQICLDILAILDRDASFIFSVEKNVTFNDFIDSFDQEVSGYWFKLDINVPAPLDNCAVPKSTVTVVEYLGEEVSEEPTPQPPLDNTSLIFTIDTTKTGSASNTFVLPLAAGTTNISVNWGDGNVESIVTSGNKTHVYSASGIYEIKITGSFVGIRFANTGDCLKMTELKQWGDVVWETLFQSFMGCGNLTTTYTDTPTISSGSKSFTSMIYNCLLWTSPINNFNYTGATNYQQLAMNSAINESFANLPLANVASGGSAMTNILTNTDMTSANVDATLNGWWAQAPSIPSNVSIRIGAGVRTSASDTAVTGLTSAPYNWTITNP